MDHFSVIDYEKLSGMTKAEFNKALAQRLSPLRNEINNDDVLATPATEEFIASSGLKAANMVSELYHRAAAGIQAGSGDQNLFHCVIRAFTECWEEINKQ